MDDWTTGKDLLYQAVGLARELTPQLPELPDEDGAASHWAGLKTVGFFPCEYPLVNIQKTMENHHFEWENEL